MTIDHKTFTPIEQESIILGAVMGMVDDLVNHAIFCPLGEKRQDTNLLPRTSDSLRQFGTLLRDFLSPVTALRKDRMPFDLPKPENSDIAADHSSLFYLRKVCENPQISSNTQHLLHHVDAFRDWLEEHAIVDGVWLANINLEIKLRIKRIDFIRMSGDIGKHNFLRLNGQVKRLRNILVENGITIDESDAYLALPDCWDWFHSHLMNYHASTIAEFLNNIRYAIRLYVAPTAASSLKSKGIIQGMEQFTFDRPDGITDKFAWANYFDLLQSTRRQPKFPLFSVSQAFKSRF